MICENCGKEHDGSYGSGRFCSKSCTSSFTLKKLHQNKKHNLWKCKLCNICFNTRKELNIHRKEIHLCDKYHHKNLPTIIENPICPFCGEKHKTKQGMTFHLRLCKNNPNRDIIKSNEISQKQKIAQNKTEIKILRSKIAKEKNYGNHSKRKNIFYESKNNGTIRLDSLWELIVAKRLDYLNLNWYKPNIRIPYVDKNNKECGYFPDFYVENYKCFIEVKSPYILKQQNKNGKIDYLKSNYDFIFWIESEELCKTFELYDMHYPYKVEKEIDNLINIYKKIEKENKNKIENSKILKNLKNERWNIIQNSNINFQKFGWVSKISKLFNISFNQGGKYIQRNFPEFYKNCFKRNEL